ncbi:KdsC family phosphatase, partial [Avibacterium paragallinarum]
MILNEKLQAIKLVITDVDGVLTDGLLHYDANGEAIKSFHVRDGLGIRMLMENGVQVAVLSGRDSPILRKRLADLGISLFLLGKLEKESACFELMQQAGVTPEQTAYIGDDSVDLPAFAVCGLSFAVGDAMDYVQNCADYVLQ